jgi:hypothetical protein
MALGTERVTRRAAEGDMEAQFSLGGLYIMTAAIEGADAPCAAERLSMVDVGLEPLHNTVSVADQTEVRWVVTSHAMTVLFAVNPGRRRAWRYWMRRQGKGTLTLCMRWEIFTSRGMKTSTL